VIPTRGCAALAPGYHLLPLRGKDQTLISLKAIVALIASIP
jgi:hypothetical protein